MALLKEKTAGRARAKKASGADWSASVEQQAESSWLLDDECVNKQIKPIRR